jgi:V8-like Glu-specific endopeptidase
MTYNIKHLIYLSFAVVLNFLHVPFAISETTKAEDKKIENVSVEEIRAEIDRRIRLGSFASNLGESKSVPSEEQPKLSGHSNSEIIRIADRLGGAKIIYGIDDRKDWWEFYQNEEIKKLAKATVILIPKESLSEEDGKYRIETKILREIKEPLCSGEKFEFQRTAGYCSGTLVSKNLVLTAGHCLREISKTQGQPFLSEMAIVFGFRVLNEGDVGPTTIEKDHVYFASDERAGGRLVKETRNDWGFIKLKSKDGVEETVAEPVTQIQTGKISSTAKVFVIGHPDGLPVKYAPNAEITNNNPPDYFVARLDAFGGNSGSGVYDQNTKSLVGILVHGGQDYKKVGNCWKANYCPISGCNGELVTRIDNVEFP